MERVTCGIIQDLLPSYRDGLTGEGVTEMLGEHLAECTQCKQRYEEIKRQQELADNEEASRGRSFWEKMRSIKYYVVGFVVGLTLPVFLLALWFLLASLESYITSMLLY